MKTIKISLEKFYENGNKYFAYMPEVLFNALELAYLDKKSEAVVNSSTFFKMLYHYYKSRVQKLLKC